MVEGRRRWTRSEALGAALAGGVFLLAALFVLGTLRREEPPTFPPTATMPMPAGERLVGPRIFTVDARSGDQWRYFSFAQGTVLDRPAPADWDLAFRRFHIIANGGERFAGDGAIADLGPLPFDSVIQAPDAGWQRTVAGSDSTNPAIERWYNYGFLSHLLTPKPHVYAVRTADGRYAKLELLGYYCPGAAPGCVTFRYVYQGDGSRRLAPADQSDE
jgi:hypothetical protein